MKYFFFLFLFPSFIFAQAGKEIAIYPLSKEIQPLVRNGKEDMKEKGAVAKMYSYTLPNAKPNTPVLLIFPGGGYTMHAIDHEGHKIAKWANKHGAHAFVLKYRLGKFDGSGNKHPDMLDDAKRAIKYIRHHAKDWNADPNMIAIMGFSAGGHLASTLSTHFDDGIEGDAIDSTSSLPNICVLAYPVISLNDEYTHWGSRRFLLGPTPKAEDIEFLSSQNHVQPQTPPTFIFSTSDDKSVPVQNSVNYYLALRKMGIPATLHVFEHGPHGVGLAENDTTLVQWKKLLENWLIQWGVFEKQPK